MRHAFFALLTLLAQPALAYEVESETVFSSTGEASLRILSTMDTEIFAPFIAAFQRDNPGVTVIYTTVSSTQVNAAVEEGASFDLAISSAMDLQTKLANDGHTRPHASDATALVPDWGRWRDSVFAFTQEPAAVVLNRTAFEGLPLPRTRQDLIDVLRDHPDRFAGRIGTYDVRISGLGYLFATQDSRTTETYWRLTELMGALGARLYCCSGLMIDDVASGDLAIAYNVLGTYAETRTDLPPEIEILAPEDYTAVMLRSVVILRTVEDEPVAEAFVDALLNASWSDGTPPFPNSFAAEENARPIPLGPGLLVFLDRLKREQFLEEWESAIVQ